jgi:hypothetical protein
MHADVSYIWSPIEATTIKGQVLMSLSPKLVLGGTFLICGTNGDLAGQSVFPLAVSVREPVKRC